MQFRVKTTIASAVLLSLTGGAALADGMVSLKDTPAPAAPSWSGLYFGGSIGYGRNDSKNNYHDSDGDRSSVSEDANGGLVSLVWGIDCMLRDRIVVGAFVDFDWSDIDRGFDGNEMTIDRSVNIGARLGYLITENTLLFATAGYSRAHFDNGGWWDFNNADGFGATLPGKGSVDFNGYFIGGGAETRLGASNFFLRGEVRYAKYDEEVTNAGTFAGVTYVDKEDPELWTGRLGVVYKLGRGEGPFADGSREVDTVKVANYTGIDVAKDAWAIYSGTVFALNGDFSRSGFVARSLGVYAEYDYEGGSPLTQFDAKDRSIDAMLGYMHYFGDVSAIVYLGMEIRDVDISPNDPTNDVRGTETGFKVAVEIETEGEGPLYYSFDGSYSTAFDSFFALGRVGYNAQRYVIGPEGAFYSDEGDWSARVGAFTKIPFTLRSMPSELTVHGGYQFIDEDDNGTNGGIGSTRAGGEGAYGGAMVKFLF
ncbi:cellulose biosynthesis protein BcsS [Hyphomicrobium sp.]|uniref:cellulose biosynthesis protein BcsS n=1 Tax=Hyphomicrobium sp. TaxID=82 RepID=UPI002E3668FE|nr:cellulose biosynthesis protein BcsS [Hyphomicrobium sp.]HEX2842313.1 cellulose biosynthesis protein BcsS [Hyphomicrobium sp.]